MKQVNYSTNSDFVNVDDLAYVSVLFKMDLSSYNFTIL